MKLSHPTADGIARPARNLPRPVRLALLTVLATAALGGFGARAALAADPVITLSLSAPAIPDGGSVTMTATVTGTAAIPTGRINFIDAAVPTVPIGTVSLPSAGSSHTVVAQLTTSSLQTKATAYSIYAEYVPDGLAGLAGLRVVQSAPQSLTVGTIPPVPHPTQVVLSAPADVISTTPVTLSATVSELPPGTATPTGKVQFVDMISGVPTLLTASDGTSDFTLDGHGTAQLVLTLQEGPHQIEATYNGNAQDASSSSPGVFITSRPLADVTVTTETSVVISPTQSVAGDLVTITATVVQTGPGAPQQPTGPVTFSGNSILGNNVFIATADLGTAPAGLTAAPNQAIIQTHTLQPANYTIVASYRGDLYDKASGGQALLAILPPGTTLYPTSVTYTGAVASPYHGTPTLAATLRDAAGGPLANRTLTFTLGTQSCTAVTGALGVGSCQLPPLTSPAGLSSVTVRYAGDASTLASAARNPFTILAAPTTLTVTIPTPGGAPSTTVSATLLDTTSGSPLSGKLVTLTFGAASCTVPTNGSGVATCPLPTPSGASTNLTASFAGDLGYAASLDTQPVVLLRPTVTTYTGPTTGVYDDQVVLSGSLTESNGTAVPGQPVAFTVGTQSCTAPTDATGIASCSILLTQPAGSTTVKMSYAGDTATYLGQSTTTSFTIAREDVALIALGPSGLLDDTTISLSALLLEDNLVPVSGRAVTLTLGSSSCPAVTNSRGVATCTVPHAAMLGPASFSGSFAQDDTYLGATFTRTVFLASFATGGAFVIGDLDTQGAVSFWGAQWSKENHLSRSDAPPSFKGWAQGTFTSSGNATWSTDPGNSPPPPAAPLPAYMAVIQTGSTSKAGSLIVGDIVHVVVVKTDPGYAPNAGHDGTGTIVATVR